MSKQQKPEASKPLDIPVKSIKIKPEQDEDLVIGSIGSAERAAWAQSFLQQIKVKEGKSQDTTLIGAHEDYGPNDSEEI